MKSLEKYGVVRRGKIEMKCIKVIKGASWEIGAERTMGRLDRFAPHYIPFYTCILGDSMVFLHFVYFDSEALISSLLYLLSTCTDGQRALIWAHQPMRGTPSEVLPESDPANCL